MSMLFDHRRRLAFLVRPVLVGAILTLHALLVWYSSRQNFATFDEVGFLASGVAHWETGTYRYYSVNPPLPRMLATLPVWMAEPVTTYPDPVNLDTPGSRPEMKAGLLLSEQNAERYLYLLRLSRLAGIVWSVAGGWLVWRWGGELYGPRGGWVPLVLWSVSPSILAHAPLLTPDLPTTVAGLAATYAFWHYLRQPSWPAAIRAGLLLGIALLCKFTLLVLYVVWPLLWLAYLWARRSDSTNGWPGWRRQAGQLGMVVFLSLLVIHWGYNFTGAFRPLGSFTFVSRRLGGEPPNGRRVFTGGLYGNRFYGTWLAPIPVPVPADYLIGIDTQARDFDHGSFSYLRGQWREVGCWYYYLYALGVKVPVGAAALVLWGLALTLARHRASAPWPDELVLWLPVAAILILVSSQVGINHHMRYILPLFPFAMVATGKLGYFLRAGHWKAGALDSGPARGRRCQQSEGLPTQPGVLQ